MFYHQGEKKRGEVKREYGGIWEEEGNTDYGRMVQPGQKNLAPYEKGVEWGLGIYPSMIPQNLWFSSMLLEKKFFDFQSTF